MVIEYPKALYRDGDYTAVADADEEKAARADGWDDWQADQDAMNAPADEPKPEPAAEAEAPAKTRTKKD